MFHNNKAIANIYPQGWDKKLRPKSGKVEDIVEWAYNSRIIEYHICSYSKKALNEIDNTDKAQDIYIMLMEVPQEKWDRLYEEGYAILCAYVIGVVKKQIYSDKSALYKKYEKYRKTELISDELFWKNYDDDNE